MIRRLVIAAGVACASVAAFLIGTAYAGTTTDLGGFGLEVKQVQETFTSPDTGPSTYKAPCPAGYSPVGGGGFAQRTSPYVDYLPLLSSAPYDDGNRGWQVTYNPPNSNYTISVYATCMRIT
jgi:hypothetical protein